MSSDIGWFKEKDNIEQMPKKMQIIAFCRSTNFLPLTMLQVCGKWAPASISRSLRPKADGMPTALLSCV